MKRLLTQLILLGFCASASFGAFDYTISNTYEYGVSLHNSESLLITGGGADQIDAYNNSFIEVQGTEPLQLDIGGIGALALNHNSSLHFYDGEMSSLWIYGSATAVFEGGLIDYIRSYQYVNWLNWEPVDQHIEIICREVTTLTDTLLEGIWNVDSDNNGQWDMFSIQLVNQSGYDLVRDNIKITLVPEPASLALLALGGLLIRRK